MMICRRLYATTDLSFASRKNTAGSPYPRHTKPSSQVLLMSGIVYYFSLFITYWNKLFHENKWNRVRFRDGHQFILIDICGIQ
jgi:hypothetical protein